MAEKRGATFDNMIREHILLPIDPEVIESFLATVEDLREVGSLRPEYLMHLPVKHLVGVSEIIPVGARLDGEAKTAH